MVRPNYATNLETPRAIGCSISFVDLQFETGFRLDFEKLAAEITPRTRLVSVTCPHNPSGVMFTAEELRRLVALTEANGCYLLVDETYRDLSYEGPLPLAATARPARYQRLVALEDLRPSGNPDRLADLPRPEVAGDFFWLLA